MRYLSVCAGIEAATVAWHSLGWHCAGVSEIDKYPRAVLEHRLGAVPVGDDHRWQEGQNFIPLFGDFTQIRKEHVGHVDLLVGGTPCQSFSIAGQRLGLDDPRGNLALEFLALAKRIGARFILWENVPGVLSHDRGRTFGTFLGFVEECGYRWAYRTLDAQYVRVGMFPRAVPQRRRRVFLVGYSGDINPAAVLFDRESLRGDPAPRREAGQRPTPILAARTRGGGGLGTDFDCDGGLIAAFNKQRIGEYSDELVSSTVSARDYKDATDLVAHSLRGEGLDASEDGTGRGTPIVPVQHPVAIQERAVSENPDAGPDGKGWRDDGAAYTLEARATVQAVAIGFDTYNQSITGDTAQTLCSRGDTPGGSAHLVPAIAFSAKDSGADASEGASPTLRAGGHAGSHANAGVMPAVAFAHQAGGKQTSLGFTDDGTCQTLGAHQTPAVAFKIGAGARAGSIGLEEEVSPTLTSTDSGTQRAPGMLNAWGVRRLTPTECARLQGFPDGWARIPWRGKPEDQCPDGPQYKCYGNSMAVNVMRWIGERMHVVHQIEQAQDLL
jgi:DNA (cytosine-5)-methyltransferase 1